MLRSALLALGVVAFATACADSVPLGPDAAGVPVLSLSAAAGAVDTLAPGETVQVTASLPRRNARGNGQPARWSTSAPDVATVSGNGLVTAVAAGTAVITAENNMASQSVTIVVATGASAAEGAPADSAQPADSTAPADVPDTTQAPVVTPPVSSGGPAELPRAYVDVAMPAVTGRTIAVAPGGDLQAAIDAAQFGDEIVLTAGATYVGPFELRDKGAGSGWIVIRTSGALPSPGTRVTPGHAAQMPKLVSRYPSEAALRTTAGAHHFRLIGLEVTGAPGQTWAYSLLTLGDGSSAQLSLDQVPHHLVLDRMFIHGLPEMAFQRCIGLNSAQTAIVDSWVSDCHTKNMDSQAIAGWNGPGPYKIVNNYVAGAGENIMFGGADPHISGLTPSDIEIRRNHIHKPLDWRGTWTAKNLLELKHGQRVLVEGNVLENNWADGQTGFAVQLTPLTDNNTAPWTRVMDVTFRHNVVRNSAAGINVSARNAYGAGAVMPTEPAQRIHFYNNAFLDIGTNATLGTNGRLFQLLGDLRDVRIENNTALPAHSIILFDAEAGVVQTGLVVVNNVFGRGQIGIFGSGSGEGSASLARYAPDAVVTGNVLIGASSALYPAGNYFPSTVGDVGFVGVTSGDLRIGSGSPYASVGANHDVLDAQIAGVRQ